MSNIFQLFKQIPRPYLGAILSGFLIGTSYIPFPGWALLFCYIPLWIAVLNLNTKNASFSKIFFAAWLTQFILTVIGFNWIFYTAKEFGNFNWIISLMALLTFASSMHIYIPLSALAAVWIIRKKDIRSVLIQFLILALTLSLTERVWPSIFEWNLAYSLLHMKIPIFQWADTVGFWGLSTWIFLTQALLAFCWSVKSQNKNLAIKIFLLLLSSLIVLTTIGLYKEKKWTNTDSSLKVAVVQGNIGNTEKIQAEKKDTFQTFILESFTNLTEQHLQKNPDTDLIIWPETAMPFALDSYFQNRYLQKTLLQKVQLWDRPLLTGAYSQSLDRKDHLGYPLTRNSVFFLSPLGTLATKTYNKTALLVFGEYLPFGEQLPFLYKLFPFVGVYERGPGPSPEKIELKNQNNVTMGPQICYESLDPAFSRGLAKKGADVLFNVTNDSWFGAWAEPFQHNIMTLARAVENRRPLVRTTNTGVSSAILASGKILENSKMNVPWAHTYNITYLKNADQSFYTQYGYLDWIIWLILLGLLIIKGKYVRN